jgi:hypothetical protein
MNEHGTEYISKNLKQGHWVAEVWLKGIDQLFNNKQTFFLKEAYF